MQNLTPEIISAAIEGFESQKARIDEQIAELRGMLPSGRADGESTPEASAPKRRKFSAAAIRRMQEAQKRRWAKVRGESSEQPSTPQPEKPKKRHISEEGMKRIIAATKKRWALKRAADAAAARKQPAPAGKNASAAKKTPAKSATAKASKKAPAKKGAAAKKTATPQPASTGPAAG